MSQTVSTARVGGGPPYLAYASRSARLRPPNPACEFPAPGSPQGMRWSPSGAASSAIPVPAPRRAPGRGADVFTSDLLRRLPMLWPCCPPSPCPPGFPRPRLRRRLGHAPSASAGIGPRRAASSGAARPGRFPRSPWSRLTGSAAGSTPAAHPRSNRSISAGHHACTLRPAWSEPAVFQGHGGCCTQPVSARFGAVLRMEGASTTGSLSLYLSVSLARARASGSPARPSRCRGCSHRSVRDPTPRLPPASPGRCISPGPASQPARRDVLAAASSPFTRRLVAH